MPTVNLFACEGPGDIDTVIEFNLESIYVVDLVIIFLAQQH